MRKLISIFILGFLVTTHLNAAEFMKTLTLSSDGISEFAADVGAGDLILVGSEKSDEITVQAKIIISTKNHSEAQELFDKYGKLSLNKSGSTAKLLSHLNIKNSGLFQNSSGRIDLEITVPKRLILQIDDGSGSISITGMGQDASVRDGSGDIIIEGIGGDLTVDDNSGSLTISSIHGNAVIDDGSGDLSIANVRGNLSINDGSGSIRVAGIEGNVVIEDGSGDLMCSEVGGAIKIDDGSGSIIVRDITGDVRIVDDGSGDFNAENIGGTVYHPDMDDNNDRSKNYY